MDPLGAIEHAPFPLVVIGPDGAFDACNAPFRSLSSTLLGPGAPGLSGFLERVPPPHHDAVRQSFAAWRENEPEGRRLGFPVPSPSSGDCWLDVRRWPLAGARTVVALEDATHERAVLDRALQNERLRALGEFADGIAHEVRNALTVIGNTSHTLAFSLASGDFGSEDAVPRNLRIATEEIARVQRLVTAFADLLDVPSGVTAVDVGEVLASFEVLFGPNLRRRGIRLEVVTDRPQSLLLDRPAFVETSLELLRTAIRTLPRGGGIRILTQQREGAVVLQLRCDPAREDPLDASRIPAAGQLSRIQRFLKRIGAELRFDVESHRPGLLVEAIFGATPETSR